MPLAICRKAQPESESLGVESEKDENRKSYNIILTNQDLSS